MVTRFGFFLSWWGAFLFAGLDSSIIVFMPFGVDALVIYLAARDERLFWLYPALAALGSLAGALVTFWIGRKTGKLGLPRLLGQARFERLRKRCDDKNAAALALPVILPPPFPLTPYVLTCGALSIDPWRFFPAYTGMRLLRFGIGALLGHWYGTSILRVLRSDAVQNVVIGFVVIAVIGTALSGLVLWRNAHQQELKPA